MREGHEIYYYLGFTRKIRTLLIKLVASPVAVSRAVAHALSADVKSYPLPPDRVKGFVAR